MKKFLIVFVGLFSAATVYALPVYNPAQPEFIEKGVFTGWDANWGIELGYRGDFIFDRRLKNRNDGTLFDFHNAICDFQSILNAGQVTLNLWECIDIYGWLGESQNAFETQVDYISVIPAPPSGFINLMGSTKEGLAYGYGVRVIFWQCGATALGIHGQYAHSRSQLECLSLNGVPIQTGFIFAGTSFPADPGRYHLRTREYQVSLGISHRICWLVPYLAVKFSNLRTKFAGPQIVPNPASIGSGIYDPRLKFNNRSFFGIAIGASIVDAGRLHVTAEGRFFDENALTFAADFRF